MMNWEETLAYFDALVNSRPEFERKGKTMPYTSANGYMFSLMNKEGQFSIRLPKEEAAAFVNEYDSGPFLSHGATMKDYVLVPETLLKDTPTLSDYLLKSYEFVMSLPPKPGKSKKAKK